MERQKMARKKKKKKKKKKKNIIFFAISHTLPEFPSDFSFISM